ncbi:MAG: hypothetical protein ABJA60_03715 [Nitrosospira sp.]
MPITKAVEAVTGFWMWKNATQLIERKIFAQTQCNTVHRATSGEIILCSCWPEESLFGCDYSPLAYLLRIYPQTGGEPLNGKLGETYSEARLRWT